MVWDFLFRRESFYNLCPVSIAEVCTPSKGGGVCSNQTQDTMCRISSAEEHLATNEGCREFKSLMRYQMGDWLTGVKHLALNQH